MAVQDAYELKSATARARVPAGKRVWRTIEAGLALGYRRSVDGVGSWYVRVYKERGSMSYEVRAFARAEDETHPANDKDILSFKQAQRRAMQLSKQRLSAAIGGPLTVRRCVQEYVSYLKAEKRTGTDAEQRLAIHVLPKLGDKLVSKLTTADIEAVRNSMVRDDDDPEAVRRSKDSANRVMGFFRAALNRSFENGANGIDSSAAWDRVRPFKGVGRPRDVILDAQQIHRLLNTTSGALRNLLAAAALTGARPPHELAHLKVSDFDPKGTLHVRVSKTGPRVMTLSAEAIQFFAGTRRGQASRCLAAAQSAGRAMGAQPARRADARCRATGEAAGRHVHLQPEA